MQNLSMCRICLATDVRMCSIARSLQDMYEKLTELTFKRGDRRPLVACYICHARLRNCYRLRKSCLQSEELLTEMLTSSKSVPQQKSGTNTLRVVSALHFSLGHMLQNSTEGHVKEEALEVIHEFHQKNSKDIKIELQEEHGAQIDDDMQCSHFKEPLDVVKRKPYDVVTDIKIEPQEEQDAQIDDEIQCLHLEDPLEVVKREPYDVVTDAEDKNVEMEDVIIEENDSNGGYQSSLSTYNICPKIVKVVLERMVIRDTIPATGVTALRKFAEIDSRLETEHEDVNKSVNNKLIAISKIEKIEPTLQKHGHNKVTALDEVYKQTSKSDICSINNCFRSEAHLESHNYSKHDLTRHMYTHTGNKPFINEICKKPFAQKYQPTNHLHTGQKRFQCDTCNKCFTQKANLTQHLNTHSSEKRYQCDKCKNFFKFKSNLTRHLYTHASEKLFQCDVCNKAFTNKRNLTRHVHIHFNEKRFQCHMCNKCFTNKSNLTQHLYIHIGKKRFQCEVCKKCFMSKFNLTQHLYTHTGERRFQCDKCNKSFTIKSNLTKHLPVHASENWF